MNENIGMRTGARNIGTRIGIVKNANVGFIYDSNLLWFIDIIESSVRHLVLISVAAK